MGRSEFKVTQSEMYMAAGLQLEHTVNLIGVQYILQKIVKIEKEREYMSRHMLLYRGSLKSCNYRCSYCPFSKHPQSQRELEKDREQWQSFLKSYPQKATALNLGALMVVPYGEAMLYPWYWEGLAQISALVQTDAVGIQTNLSFCAEAFLECFQKVGGIVEKMRLWATFHPEMTTISAFAQKCKALLNAGVTLCAGSVGVPENLELLRELRAELPNSIYLWVNQMDGLRRSYTQQEKEAFLEIDPYFERELLPIRADASRCHGRLFMEADKTLRACNISSTMESGWADLKAFPEPKCKRKQCSCYLAYGGRKDFMNRVLFGKYPLFRIPRRPKAVFFDIEGTLISSKVVDIKSHQVENGLKNGYVNMGYENMRYANMRYENMGHVNSMENNVSVSADILAGLKALARENVSLFFATTLPYHDAVKRCASILHLFQGGVFAGGAHIFMWKDGEKREFFYGLEAALLSKLTPLQSVYHFRILKYQNGANLYKVTLLRPTHKPWRIQEAEELIDRLSVYKSAVRYMLESNCLQVVSAKADKAGGVEMLCSWLGISPKEAVAAGDSALDQEMIDLCAE